MSNQKQKTYCGYAYLGSRTTSGQRLYQNTEKSLRVQAYFESIDEYQVPITTENMTDREGTEHLETVKGLISSCESGSYLVMTSLYDISEDECVVEEIYGLAWNANVNMKFLDSPWADIDFLKEKGVTDLRIATDIIKRMYSHARQEKVSLQKVKELKYQKMHEQMDHNKNRQLITRKHRSVMPTILARSRDFLGHDSDREIYTDKTVGICRNTYYKYKRELQIKKEEGKNLKELLRELEEETE